MEELIVEVSKIKVEINKFKTKIRKYRVILTWSFYLGGTLLLLVFWRIISPPERVFWSLLSNICFAILLINLWVSYWIICKIKSNQVSIGESRIKLRYMVWEKICDCEQTCDCRSKMEREMAKECNSWNDGISAEMERETELS